MYLIRRLTSEDIKQHYLPTSQPRVFPHSSWVTLCGWRGVQIQEVTNPSLIQPGESLRAQLFSYAYTNHSCICSVLCRSGSCTSTSAAIVGMSVVECNTCSVVLHSYTVQKVHTVRLMSYTMIAKIGTFRDSLSACTEVIRIYAHLAGENKSPLGEISLSAFRNRLRKISLSAFRYSFGGCAE